MCHEWDRRVNLATSLLLAEDSRLPLAERQTLLDKALAAGKLLVAKYVVGFNHNPGRPPASIDASRFPGVDESRPRLPKWKMEKTNVPHLGFGHGPVWPEGLRNPWSEHERQQQQGARKKQLRNVDKEKAKKQKTDKAWLDGVEAINKEMMRRDFVDSQYNSLARMCRGRGVMGGTEEEMIKEIRNLAGEIKERQQLVQQQMSKEKHIRAQAKKNNQPQNPAQQQQGFKGQQNNRLQGKQNNQPQNRAPKQKIKGQHARAQEKQHNQPHDPDQQPELKEKFNQQNNQPQNANQLQESNGRFNNRAQGKQYNQPENANQPQDSKGFCDNRTQGKQYNQVRTSNQPQGFKGQFNRNQPQNANQLQESSKGFCDRGKGKQYNQPHNGNQPQDSKGFYNRGKGRQYNQRQNANQPQDSKGFHNRGNGKQYNQPQNANQPQESKGPRNRALGNQHNQPLNRVQQQKPNEHIRTQPMQSNEPQTPVQQQESKANHNRAWQQQYVRPQHSQDPTQSQDSKADYIRALAEESKARLLRAQEKLNNICLARNAEPESKKHDIQTQIRTREQNEKERRIRAMAQQYNEGQDYLNIEQEYKQPVRTRELEYTKRHDRNEEKVQLSLGSGSVWSSSSRAYKALEYNLAQSSSGRVSEERKYKQLQLCYGEQVQSSLVCGTGYEEVCPVTINCASAVSLVRDAGVLMASASNIQPNPVAKGEAANTWSSVDDDLHLTDTTTTITQARPVAHESQAQVDANLREQLGGLNLCPELMAEVNSLSPKRFTAFVVSFNALRTARASGPGNTALDADAMSSPVAAASIVSPAHTAPSLLDEPMSSDTAAALSKFTFAAIEPQQTETCSVSPTVACTPRSQPAVLIGAAGDESLTSLQSQLVSAEVEIARLRALLMEAEVEKQAALEWREKEVRAEMAGMVFGLRHDVLQLRNALAEAKG